MDFYIDEKGDRYAVDLFGKKTLTDPEVTGEVASPVQPKTPKPKAPQTEDED